MESQVLKFFFVFARFEYALKRTRFLSTGRRDAARPNWEKFANEIGAAYPSLDGEDFKRAREYILGKPPQCQVVVNNKLAWRDMVPGSRTECSFLLGCVQTMRNNLFHGGKFPELIVHPPERDLRLLSSGVVVLSSVATLDEEVRTTFDLDPESH